MVGSFRCSTGTNGEGRIAREMFSRVDKIVDILAWIGVQKSVREANRIRVRVLTTNY